MLRNLLSISIAFAGIIFVNIHGQGSINSGLKIGDECTFNETTKGVCAILNKCDYIIKNKQHRMLIPEQIKKTLCLSKGQHQLVCCPSLIKPQEIHKNVITRTRFGTAMCEGEEPEFEIGLNMNFDEYADFGEFKFQAMIGYTVRNSQVTDYLYLCGGALIAEDIVVTSAFCLESESVRRSTPKVVKLGAISLTNDPNDISGDSEIIEIERTKIHPDYSIYNRTHDIGLIKLKRPYSQPSLNIKPICLSTMSENDTTFPTKLMITGYRNELTSRKSNRLLKGTVNIQTISNPSTNESRFSYKDLLKDKVAVLGIQGTDSCLGDLGGPLTYELMFEKGTLTYLYGIKSRGINCQSTQPSYYTKVTPYLLWIKETIELFETDNDELWPL